MKEIACCELPAKTPQKIPRDSQGQDLPTLSATFRIRFGVRKGYNTYGDKQVSRLKKKQSLCPCSNTACAKLEENDFIETRKKVHGEGS